MKRSAWVGFASRTTAVIVGAAVVLGSPVKAQLARPRAAAADAPKLLVLPFVRDQQDSALSLIVADGVRDRLRSNHLDKFNTITRQILCENLQQSGFPCDVPLDPPVARQLIRFINARYVIEGSMIRRPGDSILVVARLSEATGVAPQAYSFSIVNAAARIGSSTGQEIANRLVDGYRSFDEVTECRRRLDLQEYDQAMRKANDALRQSPNNAGAYQCMARIFEAQQLPQDTVIWAYRQAFQRDTLNTVVMRSLAAKYQAKDDTTALLDMLKRILTIDFRDTDLRISTAQLMVRMGQADSAVNILDYALAQNPASVELLGAKAVAEAAGAHWDSAFAALKTVSDIDSTKVDSLFLYRITNYARQIPDTTAWLQWVEVGTRKVPNQLDYWYILASNRMVQGDSDGAMNAAHGLLTNLPADAEHSTDPTILGYFARGNYVIAMLQMGHGQMDSALAYGARAVGADTTLWTSIAVVYLQAGLKSYRDSSYAEAITRLQVAKDRGGPRMGVPAAFFLGLSQFRIAVHLDSLAEQGRDCDSARAAYALWDPIQENLIAGASATAQSRDVANQFLTQVIPAYRGREETMIRQYCR